MKKQEIEMLAKQLRGRERAKIRISLGGYINQAEKFKNVWFWNPPARAYARRNYERYNSLHAKGSRYTIEFNVKCSCQHIYVKKYINICGHELNLADAKKLVAILNKRR